MDLQNKLAILAGAAGFAGPSAERLAASALAAQAELPHGVSEALADSIVQALMAAHRVNRDSMEALMRGMAILLANRALSPSATTGGRSC